MIYGLEADPPFSLSVIMPVYHEGPRVIPVVMTLAHTVRHPCELIMVYDHDDDPTVAVGRDLARHIRNLRLVKNSEGPGVIGAINAGIKVSLGANVAIWCAYHVDPYGVLNDMYDLIVQGCDVVSANRFARNRRFGRGGLIKRLGSRAGNFLLWRVVGCQFGDMTTSIKVYRKTFLDKNPITTSSAGGWALSTELSIKAGLNGYRLGEVLLGADNINLITGLSRFKVNILLPHYLRWLAYGFRHRALIRKNRLHMQSEAGVLRQQRRLQSA